MTNIQKEQISKVHKGKTISLSTRQKMSRSQKGVPKSPEHRTAIANALVGKPHPIGHRTITPELKEKMSRLMIGNTIGKLEKNGRWKGGISFEPYCIKFNNEFKERVREYFGRVCVECQTTEKKNKKRLDVHHVNYDKMMCCNDVKPLFVALCRKHNAVANGDREYWEQHFTDLINEKFGGKCYFTKEEFADIARGVLSG